MKNFRILSENFSFFGGFLLKFSMYLNRRVFVMDVLCFGHLSESRFLRGALYRRSKFVNFCHD